MSKINNLVPSKNWLKMFPFEWIKNYIQRRISFSLQHFVHLYIHRLQVRALPHLGSVSHKWFQAVGIQGAESSLPAAQHVLSLAQCETCCRHCLYPASKMFLQFLRFLFNRPDFFPPQGRENDQGNHVSLKRDAISHSERKKLSSGLILCRERDWAACQTAINSTWKQIKS